MDLTNICQDVVAAAVLLRTMKESRLVLNGKVIQLKETRREIRAESQFFLRLWDTHPTLDVHILNFELVLSFATNPGGQFTTGQEHQTTKQCSAMGATKDFVIVPFIAT